MSCPACFQGVERTDAQPSGRVAKVHGRDCYIASPPGGRTAKGSVVIVPDAFGWVFVNNRLLADEYARQGGFDVYLPDFMDGNSCPLWVLDELDSASTDMSLMGWLTKPYHVALAVYGFVPFIFRNRLSVTVPRVTSFLSGLRSDVATKELPIGVAGFCWGAQHVIRHCWDAPGANATTTTNVPLNTLIDAAFVAHPSALSVPADIEKVTKPLAIAAGEKDHVTPIDTMRHADKVLAKNNVPHELEVYPGAGHGWSVRIDRRNTKQREQAEACERQAVQWFLNCFENVVRQ